MENATDGPLASTASGASSARSIACASGPNGSAAIMRGSVFTRPSWCSSVQPFQIPKSPSLYAVGTTTTSGAAQPRSSATS